MKAIYGLLPLWAGTVHLDEMDISTVVPEDMIHHGASYVPQYDNVFANMTIAENLDIGGIHVENVDGRRAEMFELFPELREFEHRDADTLSGGERQMLAMARALMVDPEILFIDEPSAGLAPNLVDRVLEYIERINDAGTAVLMVEQNVAAGLEIADRGYALSMGENHFEGPAAELFEAEEIQRLYLGE
jgi:branched-chain amino acid transport system ATP-binding protein